MLVPLFQKTKRLEQKFDEFLNTTVETGLIFKIGFKAYIQSDQEKLSEYSDKIRQLESRGDQIRRDVETQLYSETLIPESRGDVLALLENIDNVINLTERTLLEIYIERPYIPERYYPDFLELIDCTVNSIQEVVNTTRSFINEPLKIKNSLHKVYFWEKESDKHAEKLKKDVFDAEDLDLSQKFHIRYFILAIDNIADLAEDVADRLAIYSIKRSI